MKQAEFLERGLSIDGNGRVLDGDGNEYRDEEGQMHFLEPDEDFISVGTDEEEASINVVDVFLEEVQSDDYPTYRRSARIQDMFEKADDTGKKLVNDFCLLICGYSYETLKEKAEKQND